MRFFRALPPAGGFIGFQQIIKTLVNFSETRELSLRFPNHHVYLVNSGKAALYLYFFASYKKSKLKEIAIAGYTCPDVATAAIAAGFKLKLLDLNSESSRLDLDSDRLKDIETVVLSNLYGQVDEVEDGANVVVIDDACQAALSFRDDTPIGLAGNKIGVYSFGRGKAHSASGGGLLLIPRTMAAINSEASEIYSSWEKEGSLVSAVKLVKCAIYSILEIPFFYRLIVSLPFLGIGETRVELKFSKLRGGFGTKILFFAGELLKINKSKTATQLKAIYQSRIELNSIPCLDRKKNVENLIRFPLNVTEKVKAKIYKDSKVKKRAQELGISYSYPLTIADYFDSECVSSSSEVIPNAIRHAKTLITLPIGPYVTKKDIDEIFEFLKKIENEEIV